jgi:hypothetical protein
VNIQAPKRVEWLDDALDQSDDTRRARAFAEGCVERGLCPMCVASGAAGDCALGARGVCHDCGLTWTPPKAPPETEALQ